jgi:hypothetical protein
MPLPTYDSRCRAHKLWRVDLRLDRSLNRSAPSPPIAACKSNFHPHNSRFEPNMALSSGMVRSFPAPASTFAKRWDSTSLCQSGGRFFSESKKIARLSPSQQSSIAAGDRDLIAQCLQQRISTLGSLEASKADSVRAVLIALNQR